MSNCSWRAKPVVVAPVAAVVPMLLLVGVGTGGLFVGGLLVFSSLLLLLLLPLFIVIDDVGVDVDVDVGGLLPCRMLAVHAAM